MFNSHNPPNNFERNNTIFILQNGKLNHRVRLPDKIQNGQLLNSREAVNNVLALSMSQILDRAYLC